MTNKHTAFYGIMPPNIIKLAHLQIQERLLGLETCGNNIFDRLNLNIGIKCKL